MFNSRQTLLFALFGLFTVVLVLGSLTHTDYLKQTQPNVGPYWGQDESGNAVQIYPMFNFSPYAYKGIWSCGWPFALFTFEAQDVADEEGPFFPFHNLSELQIVHDSGYCDSSCIFSRNRVWFRGRVPIDAINSPVPIHYDSVVCLLCARYTGLD